ncbi:MAG: DUF3226 domain-containing protein [Cyclobacteriaceae bacterium]
MTYIVVEGIDDENFLRQLIEERVKNRKCDFIRIGTNANSLTPADIEAINTVTDSLTESTIFILDADDDKDVYLTSLGSYFDRFTRPNAFFFPDNIDPGNLETLLRTIVTSEYRPLLEDCIDGYAECVNALQLADYSVDEKAKLYVYAAALTRNSSRAAGSSRLYGLPYFDLNSSSLNPLVQFLQNHLTA